jgi:hypothetical protein
MLDTERDPERRAARDAALLAAERERDVATHEADVEYSETVAKLRERFEADLAAATALWLERVCPAQRAYNHAVVAAEQHDASAPG